MRLVWLVALVACGGGDEKDTGGDTDTDTVTDTDSPTDTDTRTDTDTTATDADDADDDGFTADVDCDDTDPAIFPGATEVCNGADDDCDQETDEDASDATAWYADADGDGVGSGAATLACDAPPGSVATDGDCDDADAGTFPGAPEDCLDPTDHNCDGSGGLVDADQDGLAACEECDDGDPAVGLAGSWYKDADKDGFGDPAVSQVACAAPVGFVAADTDCDDGDAFVSPGEARDPTDGEDDDCDGKLDEDGPLSHAADVQAIWTQVCTGCHVGAFPQGSLDLSGNAFDDIVNVPAVQQPKLAYVEPGAPSDSYLWDKLQGTQIAAGGSGVQMPKVGALTARQLDTIETWILGGANP